MKLYHSSTVIVDKPLVSFGRDNLDFGKGFYATNMKLQAEKWIQRFIMLGKNCYVNIYDYNDVEAKSNYKYKNFPEYPLASSSGFLILFLTVEAVLKYFRIMT